MSAHDDNNDEWKRKYRVNQQGYHQYSLTVPNKRHLKQRMQDLAAKKTSKKDERPVATNPLALVAHDEACCSYGAAAAPPTPPTPKAKKSKFTIIPNEAVTAVATNPLAQVAHDEVCESAQCRICHIPRFAPPTPKAKKSIFKLIIPDLYSIFMRPKLSKTNTIDNNNNSGIGNINNICDINSGISDIDISDVNSGNIDVINSGIDDIDSGNTDNINSGNIDVINSGIDDIDSGNIDNINSSNIDNICNVNISISNNADLQPVLGVRHANQADHINCSIEQALLKACIELLQSDFRNLQEKFDQLESKMHKYIYVPKPYKVTKKASSEAIRQRCATLRTVLGRLSGVKRAGNKATETAALLAAFLGTHPSVAVSLRKEDVRGLERRLTAKEDLALWASSRITNKQRRFVISALHSLGINPFAPTHAFEAAKAKLKMEVNLVFSRIDLVEGRRPCVKAESIRSVLTQKVRDLKSAGRLLQTPQFHGKLWISIGGDKGGTTTKLVASIVNAESAASVNNLVILAMYKGKDNAANLRVAFSAFGEELATIKSLPVPVHDDPNGATEDVPVEFFLTGDTQFICNALGHVGAAAVYPCPLCEVPRADLPSAGQWDYLKSFRTRTIASYDIAASDYAKMIPRRDQSQETTSVTQSPVFRIPITNVSPPQLHIALGIGTALYKALEKACWEADKAAVGLEASEDAQKQLAKSLQDLKEAEAAVKDMKTRSAQDRALVNLLRSTNQKKTKRRPTAKPCDGIICLGGQRRRSLSVRANDWVSCYQCCRWMHFACDGISTAIEIADSSDGQYKCLQCRNGKTIDELIESTDSKAIVTEKTHRELVEKQEFLTAKCKKLESIVVLNNGPCTMRLAKAIKELRIDVCAYHSRTFIGNHIRKMVTEDGANQLVGALGDDCTTANDRQRFKTLLTGFGRIQSFFVARFLSDYEIRQLEDSCNAFAADIKQLLPAVSVTPKMHLLVSHIPQFAKHHKTLGLISEQALESLHARINGIERQYAGIRGVGRRMKLIVQHHQITSSISLK